MTDENEASQEPILIMGFEPDPERTPEDVRQWYSQDRSEAGLAKAFAAASNKFWWVEDNIYDYPEGTPEGSRMRGVRSWMNWNMRFLQF